MIGLAWSISGLSETRATRAVDIYLILLLGCLLGGRAVYVAVHWPYFQSRWLEIPQVWLGGLSGVGAVWGGLLCWWCLSLFWRSSLTGLTDRLIYLGGVLTAAAWVACWQAGWGYGPAVNGAWWGIQISDEWGNYQLRFPTQLLGVCITLLTLRMLEVLQKRKRRLVPGLLAGLGLLGLSMQLLVLSFLRADPSLYWLNLRLDTWGAISLVAVSLMYLGWLLKTQKTLYAV